MNSLPCFLRLLACGMVFSVFESSGRAGTVASAGIAGGPAARCCLGMTVQQRPGVAWLDPADGAVKFAASLDSTGEVWGTSVTVDHVSAAPASLNAGICLRTVNGNPAVCYYDDQTKALKF